MDQPMILKAIEKQCKCQGDFETCEQCAAMYCEYCGEIGQRMAQTFEALFGHGPKSVIYWQCSKRQCQNRRDYDFDMGKAMAKGEL